MDDKPEISTETATRYDRLRQILEEMGSVVLAYSGGVDSTLLLKVAADTLGDKVLAVTALSATTPAHEQRDAARLARSLGVSHMEIQSSEMGIPEFTANGPDKCYICKNSRFGELVRLASERGIPWVVDGENLDDDADYRPGSRAARELGVRSPLREAGLAKQDIRLLSKWLGLPTWNKPAYACLASRIPYGEPITEKVLGQVDAAEDFIRGLGVSRQVRVRHERDTARIEVEPEAIERFLEGDIRRKLVTGLKALGYKFVALDLEGYSTGSLNRLIDAGAAENKPPQAGADNG